MPNINKALLVTARAWMPRMMPRACPVNVFTLDALFCVRSNDSLCCVMTSTTLTPKSVVSFNVCWAWRRRVVELQRERKEVIRVNQVIRLGIRVEPLTLKPSLP